MGDCSNSVSSDDSHWTSIMCNRGFVLSADDFVANSFECSASSNSEFSSWWNLTIQNALHPIYQSFVYFLCHHQMSWYLLIQLWRVGEIFGWTSPLDIVSDISQPFTCYDELTWKKLCLWRVDYLFFKHLWRVDIYRVKDGMNYYTTANWFKWSF